MLISDGSFLDPNPKLSIHPRNSHHSRGSVGEGLLTTSDAQASTIVLLDRWYAGGNMKAGLGGSPFIVKGKEGS